MTLTNVSRGVLVPLICCLLLTNLLVSSPRCSAASALSSHACDNGHQPFSHFCTPNHPTSFSPHHYAREKTDLFSCCSWDCSLDCCFAARTVFTLRRLLPRVPRRPTVVSQVGGVHLIPSYIRPVPLVSFGSFPRPFTSSLDPLVSVRSLWSFFSSTASLNLLLFANAATVTFDAATNGGLLSSTSYPSGTDLVVTASSPVAAITLRDVTLAGGKLTFAALPPNGGTVLLERVSITRTNTPTGGGGVIVTPAMTSAVAGAPLTFDIRDSSVVTSGAETDIALRIHDAVSAGTQLLVTRTTLSATVTTTARAHAVYFGGAVSGNSAVKIVDSTIRALTNAAGTIPSAHALYFNGALNGVSELSITGGSVAVRGSSLSAGVQFHGAVTDVGKIVFDGAQLSLSTDAVCDELYFFDVEEAITDVSAFGFRRSTLTMNAPSCNIVSSVRFAKVATRTAAVWDASSVGITSLTGTTGLRSAELVSSNVTCTDTSMDLKANSAVHAFLPFVRSGSAPIPARPSTDMAVRIERSTIRCTASAVNSGHIDILQTLTYWTGGSLIVKDSVTVLYGGFARHFIPVDPVADLDRIEFDNVSMTTTQTAAMGFEAHALRFITTVSNVGRISMRGIVVNNVQLRGGNADALSFAGAVSDVGEITIDGFDVTATTVSAHHAGILIFNDAATNIGTLRIAHGTATVRSTLGPAFGVAFIGAATNIGTFDIENATMSVSTGTTESAALVSFEDTVTTSASGFTFSKLSGTVVSTVIGSRYLAGVRFVGAVSSVAKVQLVSSSLTVTADSHSYGVLFNDTVAGVPLIVVNATDMTIATTVAGMAVGFLIPAVTNTKLSFGGASSVDSNGWSMYGEAAPPPVRSAARSTWRLSTVGETSAAGIFIAETAASTDLFIGDGLDIDVTCGRGCHGVRVGAGAGTGSNVMIRDVFMKMRASTGHSNFLEFINNFETSQFVSISSIDLDLEAASVASRSLLFVGAFDGVQLLEIRDARIKTKAVTGSEAVGIYFVKQLANIPTFHLKNISMDVYAHNYAYGIDTRHSWTNMGDVRFEDIDITATAGDSRARGILMTSAPSSFFNNIASFTLRRAKFRMTAPNGHADGVHYLGGTNAVGPVVFDQWDVSCIVTNGPARPLVVVTAQEGYTLTVRESVMVAEGVHHATVFDIPDPLTRMTFQIQNTKFSAKAQHTHGYFIHVKRAISDCSFLIDGADGATEIVTAEPKGAVFFAEAVTNHRFEVWNSRIDVSGEGAPPTLGDHTQGSAVLFMGEVKSSGATGQSSFVFSNLTTTVINRLTTTDLVANVRFVGAISGTVPHIIFDKCNMTVYGSSRPANIYFVQTLGPVGRIVVNDTRMFCQAQLQDANNLLFAKAIGPTTIEIKASPDRLTDDGARWYTHAKVKHARCIDIIGWDNVQDINFDVDGWYTHAVSDTIDAHGMVLLPGTVTNIGLSFKNVYSYARAADGHADAIQILSTITSASHLVHHNVTADIQGAVAIRGILYVYPITNVAGAISFTDCNIRTVAVSDLEATAIRFVQAVSTVGGGIIVRGGSLYSRSIQLEADSVRFDEDVTGISNGVTIDNVAMHAEATDHSHWNKWVNNVVFRKTLSGSGAILIKDCSMTAKGTYTVRNVLLNGTMSGFSSFSVIGSDLSARAEITEAQGVYIALRPVGLLSALIRGGHWTTHVTDGDNAVGFQYAHIDAITNFDFIIDGGARFDVFVGHFLGHGVLMGVRRVVSGIETNSKFTVRDSTFVVRGGGHGNAFELLHRYDAATFVIDNVTVDTQVGVSARALLWVDDLTNCANFSVTNCNLTTLSHSHEAEAIYIVDPMDQAQHFRIANNVMKARTADHSAWGVYLSAAMTNFPNGMVFEGNDIDVSAGTHGGIGIHFQGAVTNVGGAGVVLRNGAISAVASTTTESADSVRCDEDVTGITGGITIDNVAMHAQVTDESHWNKWVNNVVFRKTLTGSGAVLIKDCRMTAKGTYTVRNVLFNGTMSGFSSFSVTDSDMAARAKISEAQCVTFENPSVGLASILLRGGKWSAHVTERDNAVGLFLDHWEALSGLQLTVDGGIEFDLFVGHFFAHGLLFGERYGTPSGTGTNSHGVIKDATFKVRGFAHGSAFEFSHGYTGTSWVVDNVTVDVDLTDVAARGLLWSGALRDCTNFTVANSVVSTRVANNYAESVFLVKALDNVAVFAIVHNTITAVVTSTSPSAGQAYGIRFTDPLTTFPSGVVINDNVVTTRSGFDRSRAVFFQALLTDVSHFELRRNKLTSIGLAAHIDTVHFTALARGAAATSGSIIVSDNDMTVECTSAAGLSHDGYCRNLLTSLPAAMSDVDQVLIYNNNMSATGEHRLENVIFYPSFVNVNRIFFHGNHFVTKARLQGATAIRFFQATTNVQELWIQHCTVVGEAPAASRSIDFSGPVSGSNIRVRAVDGWFGGTAASAADTARGLRFGVSIATSTVTVEDVRFYANPGAGGLAGASFMHLPATVTSSSFTVLGARFVWTDGVTTPANVPAFTQATGGGVSGVGLEFVLGCERGQESRLNSTRLTPGHVPVLMQPYVAGWENCVTGSPTESVSFTGTATATATAVVTVTQSGTLTRPPTVTASTTNSHPQSASRELSRTASSSTSRSKTKTATDDRETPAATATVTHSMTNTDTQHPSATPSHQRSLTVSSVLTVSSSRSISAAPSVSSTASLHQTTSFSSPLTASMSVFGTSSTTLTQSDTATTTGTESSVPSQTTSGPSSVSSTLAVTPSASIHPSVSRTIVATASRSIALSPSVTKAATKTTIGLTLSTTRRLSRSLTTTRSSTPSLHGTATASFFMTPSATIDGTRTRSFSMSVTHTFMPSWSASTPMTPSASMSSTASLVASSTVTASTSLSASASNTATTSVTVKQTRTGATPTTTAQPSATHSLFQTATGSKWVSVSQSSQRTATVSFTQGRTVTVTRTVSTLPSRSASVVATSTATIVPTHTVSVPLSSTGSMPRSVTVSPSRTMSSPRSLTISPIWSNTVSMQASASISPLWTKSSSVASTRTVTLSQSRSAQPSQSLSLLGTATPSWTPSASLSSSPSKSSSPAPTQSVSPTTTATQPQSNSATGALTATPTQHKTPSRSLSPTQSLAPPPTLSAVPSTSRSLSKTLLASPSASVMMTQSSPVSTTHTARLSSSVSTSLSPDRRSETATVPGTGSATPSQTAALSVTTTAQPSVSHDATRTDHATDTPARTPTHVQPRTSSKSGTRTDGTVTAGHPSLTTTAEAPRTSSRTVDSSSVAGSASVSPARVTPEKRTTSLTASPTAALDRSDNVTLPPATLPPDVVPPPSVRRLLRGIFGGDSACSAGVEETHLPSIAAAVLCAATIAVHAAVLWVRHRRGSSADGEDEDEFDQIQSCAPGAVPPKQSPQQTESASGVCSGPEELPSCVDDSAEDRRDSSGADAGPTDSGPSDRDDIATASVAVPASTTNDARTAGTRDVTVTVTPPATHTHQTQSGTLSTDGTKTQRNHSTSRWFAIRCVLKHHAWCGLFIPCHRWCGVDHACTFAARMGSLLIAAALLVDSTMAHALFPPSTSGRLVGAFVVGVCAAILTLGLQALLQVLLSWSSTRKVRSMKGHLFGRRAQDLLEFGVRKDKAVGLSRSTYAQLNDVEFENVEDVVVSAARDTRRRSAIRHPTRNAQSVNTGGSGSDGVRATDGGDGSDANDVVMVDPLCRSPQLGGYRRSEMGSSSMAKGSTGSSSVTQRLRRRHNALAPYEIRRVWPAAVAGYVITALVVVAALLLCIALRVQWCSAARAGLSSEARALSSRRPGAFWTSVLFAVIVDAVAAQPLFIALLVLYRVLTRDSATAGSATSVKERQNAYDTRDRCPSDGESSFITDTTITASNGHGSLRADVSSGSRPMPWRFSVDGVVAVLEDGHPLSGLRRWQPT